MRHNLRGVWHATFLSLAGFVIVALGVLVAIDNGFVNWTPPLLMAFGIAIIITGAVIEAYVGEGHRR